VRDVRGRVMSPAHARGQRLGHELQQRPPAGLVGPLLLEGQQALLDRSGLPQALAASRASTFHAGLFILFRH
jgi:hypothetical protein